MFEKCIDFTGHMTYYEIKEFRSCSCWNGGVHMQNISKEFIIELVQKVDDADQKFLRQMYTIIKKHLEREGKR